ncbi:RICIN domain-containing protein [Streptomyces sp. NPDC091204]|uniref:RICIN domain-containing protein n=1 Tax=Streptomyces sp. NPDC091204 TaxID=3155299 RepID=UPI00342520F7
MAAPVGNGGYYQVSLGFSRVPPPPPGSGQIVGVHSGKCLDALGWATGNGARLGIWDRTPSHTNQQWRGSALGT